MSNTSYAMFSSPLINMAEVQKTQELRRRPGTVPTDDSGGTAGSLAQTVVQTINLKSPSKKTDSGRYNGSSSSGYGERNDRGKIYGGSQGQGQGGGGGSGGQYMQMQLQQQQRPTRDMSARVQGAEKVEKAISQVRDLIMFFPY